MLGSISKHAGGGAEEKEPEEEASRGARREWDDKTSDKGEGGGEWEETSTPDDSSPGYAMLSTLSPSNPFVTGTRFSKKPSKSAFRFMVIEDWSNSARKVEITPLDQLVSTFEVVISGRSFKEI